MGADVLTAPSEAARGKKLPHRFLRIILCLSEVEGHQVVLVVVVVYNNIIVSSLARHLLHIIVYIIHQTP